MRSGAYWLEVSDNWLRNQLSDIPVNIAIARLLQRAGLVNAITLNKDYDPERRVYHFSISYNSRAWTG